MWGNRKGSTHASWLSQLTASAVGTQSVHRPADNSCGVTAMHVVCPCETCPVVFPVRVRLGCARELAVQDVSSVSSVKVQIMFWRSSPSLASLGS